VAGGWGRLQNEELHNLHASLSISRVIKSMTMRWAGHVACIDVMTNACKILVGKPDGKRTIEKYECTWENNIKMESCGLL